MNFLPFHFLFGGVEYILCHFKNDVPTICFQVKERISLTVSKYLDIVTLHLFYKASQRHTSL